MIRFSFVFILLCALQSCYVETASTSKNQELVIASDYLTEEDTVLFSSFMKENDVQIVIKPVIRKELELLSKGQPFNAQIDLLMYKNLYDVHKLNKSNLIQPIYQGKNHLSDTLLTNFSSGIIGIGYDPFVFSYNADSLGEISSVGEVRSTRFKNNLSKGEQIVFLSGFRDHYDSPETMQFALGMDSNSFYSDSLLPRWQVIRLETISEKSNQLDYSLVDFGGNEMFDVRTIACFTQTSQFELAKEFIQYVRNPKTNNRLNKEWKTIPINFDLVNPNHEFRPMSKKINHFFQYYTTIERIQRKIKNGKS